MPAAATVTSARACSRFAVCESRRAGVAQPPSALAVAAADAATRREQAEIAGILRARSRFLHQAYALRYEAAARMAQSTAKPRPYHQPALELTR